MRTDNDDGRGAGIAILLHESVSFRRVRPPKSELFRDVTAVQMYDHTDTCTLFSVYVPNNVPCVKKKCLNDMFLGDWRVVIGGDYNARNVRWGCVTSNLRDISIYDYVSKHTFVDMRFSSSPTYYFPDPSRKPSVIDGFLTKNVNSVDSPLSVADLFSDHNPVILKIDQLSTAALQVCAMGCVQGCS